MKIIPPDKCPSCGSNLILVKDQLFCRNSLCPAQSIKKLEHFCKALKMKGFGPASLAKLDFSSIADLFNFSLSYYKEKLGNTIGDKLYNEVRNAEKTATLDKILAGLSIPLVGQTAASKLEPVIASIEDINLETCKAAELGEKVTSNLLEYIQSEEYLELKKLLSKFNKKSTSNTNSVNSNGLKVCITGKLLDYKSRTEASRYLESLGFKVVDSVTKTTDILINEDDRESSKLSKAITLGIRVMTIKELEKEI